jgi:hypothetical protein
MTTITQVFTSLVCHQMTRPKRPKSDLGQDRTSLQSPVRRMKTLIVQPISVADKIPSLFISWTNPRKLVSAVTKSPADNRPSNFIRSAPIAIQALTECAPRGSNSNGIAASTAVCQSLSSIVPTFNASTAIAGYPDACLLSLLFIVSKSCFLSISINQRSFIQCNETKLGGLYVAEQER